MNSLIPALVAAAVAGTTSAYIERDDFQHCFMVGDYLITDSQPQWEWITDTPMTDEAEVLLKEKYGRDFICSYCVYPLEWSLCIDEKAAPADDPQMEFYVCLGGRDGLEILDDHYINMLYMDEMSEWLYEGIDIPETDKDGLILYSCGKLTEQEAVSKQFEDEFLNGRKYCQHSFDVIILTDAEGAEKLDARHSELIESIGDRLGCEFMLYIGTESFYDPTRGELVSLGSRLDYNELFYTYDCRGIEYRAVGKAAKLYGIAGGNEEQTAQTTQNRETFQKRK